MCTQVDMEAHKQTAQVVSGDSSSDSSLIRNFRVRHGLNVIKLEVWTRGYPQQPTIILCRLQFFAHLVRTNNTLLSHKSNVKARSDFLICN